MNEPKKSTKLKVIDLVLIALSSALMAVGAWITIPIPAVPFTLQLLFVYMALFTLGGKRGSVSIAVYVLLGAVGLPVFSGFRGGIGVLLGTTGGYIAGFVFTGLLYWVMTSLLPKKPWAKLLSAVSGLIICYCIGTAWFIIVYMKSTGAIGVWSVLLMCVIPFIIPDIVKIAAAFGLSKAIARVLSSRFTP